MQNFLPFADFDKSASVLDNKRLVKQNLETRQCLNALCGFGEGWKNHPAVKAWTGYIRTLIYYGITINEECVKRGFKDCSDAYKKYLDYCAENSLSEDYPKWFGNEAIHSSHRSRLLCKGEIDVLCDAVKKHFKIKKIDDWCKANFKLTKNALRYEHVAPLKQICLDNKITVAENFYLKYGWKDDPSKPYIWP